MPDHDLNRFIQRWCADHGVDFETLDDNIKALVETLATHALDAKRMEGVLAPQHETEERIRHMVHPSTGSPRVTTLEDHNPFERNASRGTT